MAELTGEVECVFCGAALCPERAAAFLEQQTDDEFSPQAAPPVCQECQSGIDENDREREADAARMESAQYYPLLRRMLLIVLGFLVLLVGEALWRMIFGGRRG